MKMKKIGLFLLVLLIGGMLIFGAESTRAADFPEKRITLFSWASEGGGSDRFNNALKRGIDENDLYNHPVVTDCKPGGGGATGMSHLQSQDADGYNVLKVTTNLVLTPLTKEFEYNYEDFEPIARMAIEPEILYVKSDADWNTIDEFEDYAQDNDVKAGMYGSGTQNHVALLVLADEIGESFKYVPYDGGGKAISALLGGEVDIVVSEPSEVESQVEAGEVRPLLTFSKERLPVYPGTPTLADKYNTDTEVMQFRGYVVKEGTPEERVDYLRDLFEEVYDTDEVQDYMAKNNMEPSFLKGEEFFDFVEDQKKIYEKFLSEEGMVD